MGGAIVRFPRMLELRDESLMSDATLAESESKSSHDPPLLGGREEGLRLQPPIGYLIKNKQKREKNEQTEKK